MRNPRYDRPMLVPRFETVSARQHHAFGRDGYSAVRDRWYRVVVRIDGEPVFELPDAEARALADRLETDYRTAVAAGRLAADGTPPEGGCDEWLLEEQVTARLHALGWAERVKPSWPVQGAFERVSGLIAVEFARERYDLLGDAPTQTLADVPDGEFNREARRTLDREGALIREDASPGR